MLKIITQNIDYFYTKGCFALLNETSDSLIEEFNKAEINHISLFSHLGEDEQDIHFNKILDSLDNFNFQIHFFKRFVEDSIVWHCFIKKQHSQHFLQCLIQNSSFDYLIWPKNNHPSINKSLPKLIIFDMDSTFIKIEVIDELAKAHNVGDKVSQVTESAMRGELDFAESLITRVACLKGLTSSTIEFIAEKLPISEGVERLVKWAHLQNIKIAIVSGGFTPFVEKLKKQLNLYQVKANNLEIKDNQLTGRVLGKIVDAQAKADFVNDLRNELKLNTNEIMSIGDGANDLLMMKETGFSLAYRAKPAVDKEAGGRMKSTNLDQLIEVFNIHF